MKASAQYMVKKLYNLGFLGFAILLALSLIFYKERSFFLDASYYIYELVRTQRFAIFHFRNIAIFPELLPLSARWLNADLKVIAMLFSFSYVLIHLLCYWLCGIMKRYEYGLILLLYNLLLTTDSFYALPSELPPGIAFSVLMLAFIEYRHSMSGKSTVFFTFLIVAILDFFIVFSHPLALFPLSYMILWLFIYKKELKKDIAISGIILLAFSIFKLVCFTDEYDVHSSSGIRNMLDTNYFDLPSQKIFFNDLFTKFYWLPVFFVWVSIHLISQKKWLLFTGFVCFLVGYLLLVNVTFGDNSSPPFYIENFYLPLAVFLAVPFVFHILPLLSPKVSFPILLLIILTTGIRIYNAGNKYTARINWERHFLATHKEEKLMLLTDLVPRDTLMVAWATPYEFWLLSTVEQGKTASLLIHDSVSTLSWAKDNSNSFVTEWRIVKYSELPGQYFKFTDSTNNYQLIEK